MRRLSLRYKILLLVVSLVLASVGTFLYIATSLFRQDKLVYVYDLQSAMVESLSEQTRSTVELLLSRTRSAAPELRGPGGRRAAEALFLAEPDVVRVRSLAPARDGRLEERWVHVHEAARERLGLDPDALDELPEVPAETAAVEASGSWHLVNASLPPDVALMTVIAPGDSPGHILAIDFASERLLRLFARSRVHESYLVNALGEVLVHPDAQRVVGRTDLKDQELVRDALRASTGRAVQEFTDPDGRVFLGAWSRMEGPGMLVVTQLPKDDALRASRELVRRSVLFAIAILCGSLLASVFFARALTAPLRRLSAAAEEIGKGRFDVEIDRDRRDEIGDLGRTLHEAARTLEKAQEQLVHGARMAAFGQIGAGITHEVRNPITGIVSLAQLAQTKLHQPEKAAELLQLIEKEGLRSRDILANLLRFAREEPPERSVVDAVEVVRDAARIVEHQLGIHGVRLETTLADQPVPILADAGQLQQVLVNLALNAQQALAGREGRVILRCGADGADGLIEVEDDGPGMPPEVRARIFEPFFTTKGAGKGSGLGLSVSHSIVKEHGGTFDVESEPGKGARFILRIPLREEGAGRISGAREGGP